MSKFQQRLLRCAGSWIGLALAAASGVSAQTAEQFPRQALRIIVPFAAGGAPDIVARTLGARVAESLGREVIVENRTGAGGNIGFEAGARAAPDGHTLLVCTFGCATNMALFEKLAWDPKDFAPVVFAGQVPNVLVVNPALAAKNVMEFVALAKAGKLSMASSGTGSASHLAGEMFKKQAEVQILHVPYRGSTAALPDIVAGRVDSMIVSVPEAMSLIRGGQLRALGTSGGVRASSLPEVPTIAESGLKDYQVSAWSALVVPAATPAPIVARLNREFNAALSHPDTRKRFSELSVEPGGGGPERLAEFMRAQTEAWSRLIRELGIRAN
ncbi:MAG: Bug family tripartite tricarboxylate transporter substrate binding protein [Burkholderiales bacterium]